jgi:glycosyltransferase involved in cell wall biosynthesis
MNIVKFYLNDTHACGYIRGDVPARAINRMYPNWHVDCKTHTMSSDFARTNIMIFQRSFTQGMLDKLRLAKSLRIKTIYEVDDDLFNIPPGFENPHKAFSDPTLRAIMTAFLQEADAVTTSTLPLAETLQKIAPNQHFEVIRNSIDLEMWESSYQHKQTLDNPVVTLGWMASGSHVVDLPMIRPVLESLLQKYPNLHLHCIGGIKDEMFSEAVRQYIFCEDWVEISRLPSAMIDFDIGLAPLADNPFNRSKSGIKALQYWALGIPTVASPLPVYDCIEHGKDGFLAGTPEEWEQHLSILIEQKALRTGLGTLGRRKVVTQWDSNQRAEQWISAFERILRK